MSPRTQPPAPTPPESVHGIVDALLPLSSPIENLHALDGNPRRGDVKAVARSFRQFGQRKPIVAKQTGTDEHGRPTGIVTAGNHSLLAARDELGWGAIAVVFVKEDEMSAKAYALADNRTHDLGTYDDDALAEMLAEIIASDDAALLEATAYDEAAIRKLLGGNLPPPDADTDPALGGQAFQIIVECTGEAQQADLLQRFDQEGLICRPLMM